MENHLYNSSLHFLRMNTKRDSLLFFIHTFHNAINPAKDLILSLKFLYAYEPSHKHNCNIIKMPCTAKVEIPWHVCEHAHLPKPTWELFILNYSISQVKLLDCMNWDHCFLQFHGIERNSHESEGINSYAASKCLRWALPLQIIFTCVALHWIHTSLILGWFSFQTLSTSVVGFNSVYRAVDMNVARAKVPS